MLAEPGRLLLPAGEDGELPVNPASSGARRSRAVPIVDAQVYGLISAIAHGDAPRTTEIAGRMDELRWPGGPLVIGVAFAHAVRDYFGRDWNPREVERVAADAITGQVDGPTVGDVMRRILGVLDEPWLTPPDWHDTHVVSDVLVLALLLPRIRRGEAVEAFVGEVRQDVVRLLIPPVGVGVRVRRTR